MERGNVRSCAYCAQDKAWINTGKKLKDGSKIYVDENEARWSGRRCPDCERSRVYAAVRCDGFERDLIVRQLEESGFEIQSRTLPLKATKDGKTYTVGVKRACTTDGKILLEQPLEPGTELVALLFESVRIFTPDQIERMQPSLDVRSGPPQRRTGKGASGSQMVELSSDLLSATPEI